MEEEIDNSTSRQFTNNSWRPQYSTLNNEENNYTDDWEENRRLEQYCKATRPNRHLLNMARNSRIHILGRTQNIFQAGNMLCYKTSLDKFQSIKIIQNMSPITME